MTPVRRHQTALVVDDSPVARRRIRTLLRLGGWRVHEAVGMTDALRQASGMDLDLVVTDMTMREGNGPALLRSLRAGGCSARFLAVSANVTTHVRERADAAGADACLAKPVDPRLVLDFLLDRAGEPSSRHHPDGHHRVLDYAPALHIQAERLDRVRKRYVNTVPHRLLAITSSGQRGDTETVAADARRRNFSQAQLMQLVAFRAWADRGRSAPSGQATRGQATSR
jgi:CheY-like chemotaxis protein